MFLGCFNSQGLNDTYRSGRKNQLRDYETGQVCLSLIDLLIKDLGLEFRKIRSRTQKFAQLQTKMTF